MPMTLWLNPTENDCQIWTRFKFATQLKDLECSASIMYFLFSFRMIKALSVLPFLYLNPNLISSF